MTADDLRYKELLARGRELTAAEQLDALRSLARSPHYPALLACVRDGYDFYTREFSDKNFAEKTSVLQHTAGSLYALSQFEAKLRAALKMPKLKQGPSEEE